MSDNPSGMPAAADNPWPPSSRRPRRQHRGRRRRRRRGGSARRHRPELGINVVDLGLLYGVSIEPDGTVVLDMTLTTAACPLTDVIEEQAQQALSLIADKVRIQWVWLPPWGPDKITPEGREQLRALGFNV